MDKGTHRAVSLELVRLLNGTGERSLSLTALLVMAWCNAQQCSEKQSSLALGSCSHCLWGWLQNELLSAPGFHPDRFVTTWLLKALSPFLG